MIDPSDMELAAMASCLAPLGEYVGAIGMQQSGLPGKVHLAHPNAGQVGRLEQVHGGPFQRTLREDELQHAARVVGAARTAEAE